MDAGRRSLRTADVSRNQKRNIRSDDSGRRNNSFSPRAQNRGPTTVFPPGVVNNAFRVPFANRARLRSGHCKGRMGYFAGLCPRSYHRVAPTVTFQLARCHTPFEALGSDTSQRKARAVNENNFSAVNTLAREFPLTSCRRDYAACQNRKSLSTAKRKFFDDLIEPAFSILPSIFSPLSLKV